MRLATNNLIEAYNAAGTGLDLRAWGSGTFKASSKHANVSKVVDVTFNYDFWGDPEFMLVDFDDGFSAGLLLETDRYGVYATSGAEFDGNTMRAFVGYGLSKSPSALNQDPDDHQFFLSWSDLDAIASGRKAAPLGFFSLAGHDEINGNRYADYIVGAGGNDILRGLGGNDHLWGGSGHDLVAGGTGNDRLNGDGGNDYLYGDAGNDTISGGAGNDRAWGGTGNDRITGDAGNDLLHADAGNDTIDGGAGNDRAWGGAGNDRMTGGAGNDELIGDAGNDQVAGGSGRDILRGGAGNDRIHGDAGNDKLYGGAGRDVIDGGAGNDVLWGNGGADTFVFGRGDGDDTIADFDPRYDVIEIESGAKRFRDLDISRDGHDTVIEFANVEITLEDVRPAELDADNFIF